MRPYYQDSFVTIYHSDAFEIMETLRFDVVVTDPPYGCNATSGWGGKHSDFKIHNDEDSYERDRLVDFVSKHDIPSLIFGSPRVPRPKCKAVLIWDKGEHTGMGDLSFPWKPCFEEIYVIGDGFAGRRTSSVISVHSDISSTRHHPTEKPMPLLVELISKCPTGTILDPFMGSGTTLRAAKDLGRKAIGIEIEEKYCEIAAKRLSQEVFNFSETVGSTQTDLNKHVCVENGGCKSAECDK